MSFLGFAADVDTALWLLVSLGALLAAFACILLYGVRKQFADGAAAAHGSE